jgi:two-component system phosphate regulon sensor histidine kinase PhoR
VFAFEAVPVGPLVGAALERYRTRAEARRQTLAAESAGGEVVAWADEEAVEQILDNLLDNALKYTPEGGHIRVGWRNGDGQVWLEVSDTGIGIPEADLPRIFERFYRVDKARSREMGGTGLGLSIVKHLVQAMHGSVRASSQPGHGTTFTVCLPLAPGGA